MYAINLRDLELSCYISYVICSTLTPVAGVWSTLGRVIVAASDALARTRPDPAAGCCFVAAWKRARLLDVTENPKFDASADVTASGCCCCDAATAVMRAISAWVGFWPTARRHVPMSVASSRAESAIAAAVLGVTAGVLTASMRKASRSSANCWRSMQGKRANHCLSASFSVESFRPSVDPHKLSRLSLTVLPHGSLTGGTGCCSAGSPTLSLSTNSVALNCNTNFNNCNKR